jgi:hypothetical protein
LTDRTNDLKRLAGRITPDDAKVFEDLVKKYREMPALLRRMRDEPEFAQKLLHENTQLEGEERKS